MQRLAISTLAALALIAPAIAQDVQAVKDRSGRGSVLCTWSIYVAEQAAVSQCKLERLPVDDAISQAITDIDAYISANTAAHLTADQIAAKKAEIAAKQIEDPAMCQNFDP